MPVIKFSEEWDKLKPNERKPGKWFTTFRGYEARKEVYYQNNLNKHFDVHLKGKWLGVVKLINIYCKRASELPLIFWHHDVRSDINRVEVEELMRSFYNNPDPYGLILEFQWVAVQDFLEMEGEILE